MRNWGALVVAAIWPWLLAQPAAAQVLVPPASLVAEALSEHAPSALAPLDLDAADFALVRRSGDETRVRVWFEPGSLRWVRVNRTAVVPRGVLVVSAPGATGGHVSHAGFAHPIVDGRALVPVVLLSGEAPVVAVEVARGAVRTQVSYAVRFHPRAGHGGRVAFDASCSPFGLHVQDGAIAEDAWLHVACRLVRTGRARSTEATLELYLVWDQAGAVRFAGVPLSERAPSFYTVRVTGGPGSATFTARGVPLRLGYFLPAEYHAGFLGAGIGPYYYEFDRPERHVRTAVPVLTLYAGYAFTPTARVVYFSALAMHRRGYADQGLYVWLEQGRFFDDRISINLLLGANLLVYHRVHRFVARVNYPQGAELIVRDFLRKNRNVTLGGFLYPDISGSAYYNAWLRWGSARFFGEVNYLDWREPFPSGSTRSQTFGVTFGMPLLRFL